MNNDDGNHNMRLVFRPTREQYNRLQTIYDTGRYKHLSELLRDAINEGCTILEKKIKKEQENFL